MAEREAQRGFRKLGGGNVQVFFDGPQTWLKLLLALAAEIPIPEILPVERGLGRDGAAQRPLVESHPHDHADPVGAAGVEQAVTRRLVKDVVDHLNRVHHARLDGLHGVTRLVVVDRYSEMPDPAVSLELRHRVLPVALAQPGVVPDVELLYVQGVHAQVVQAGLGALDQVLAGKHVLHLAATPGGPDAVFGRNLARHDGTGVAPCHLAHQLFAVALGVGQRGVDEVAAQLQVAFQGAGALRIFGPDPLRAADAPGPVADLGHHQARLAQRALEHAHRWGCG